MSRTLVAYFSATGRTERAARNLADATGADIYTIQPKVPYTEADLNWNDSASRATVESRDPEARPALHDTDAPIAEHDTILLGFPIWWYTAPAIIRSFLEAYDFNGKQIILFATSGGSGFGQTAPTLAKLVPGAYVEEGRVLNGAAASPNGAQQWAAKLELQR